MDKPSDREREVANCLFQIDKLCDADLRAVLRHLATDDAVFSDAQCSHIARVIDGTLHRKPREVVNARLMCASGFDAAVNWEKNFATYAYPGHVSNALRDNASDKTGDVQSADSPSNRPPTASGEVVEDGEDVVLFGTNAPRIVNKGHMNVHYHHHHYYKHPQSEDFIPATVPQKRQREDEQEHYPGSPNAPVSTSQPETDDKASERPLKRVRLQETKTEVKTELKKLQVDENPHLISVESGQKTDHVEGRICRFCGVRFTKQDNKPQANGNFPCRYHKGKRKASGDFQTRSGRETTGPGWSCCNAAPDDPGCAFKKHKALFIKNKGN